MAVGDAYVFPGFLTPVLTQLFFPKPSTTFLTCYCRGERRKYAGKKSRLNRGSNSQAPGHESNTLTTEPPGRGKYKDEALNIASHADIMKSNYMFVMLWNLSVISHLIFPQCFFFISGAKSKYNLQGYVAF